MIGITKNRFKRLLHIASVLLCILAAISFVIGCKNAVDTSKGSIDFQYDSAKLFSMGIDPYKETLNPSELQDSLNLKHYYGKLSANQFPSMLFFLLPFTLVSPITANWMWMICNVFFSIGSVVLLKSLFFDEYYSVLCKNNELFCEPDDKLWYSLLLSLFFLGLPWRNNIGNGQHTIMAFFCFLLAMSLSKQQKDGLSGVALAVSFFKYTLTIPLAVFFFYKKKYKTIATSLGIHATLTILSAIWLRASVKDMIIEPLMIASSFTEKGFLDIGATFGIGPMSIVFSIGVLVAIMVYVISGEYHGTDGDLISILILISLLITYHRIYDYFVLIVPVIVNMGKEKKSLASCLLWIITIYCFVLRKMLDMIAIEYRALRVFDFVIACCLYIVTVLTVCCSCSSLKPISINGDSK